jgi:hypothetical protein
MGILKVDTKQEGKMKILPKKPKQNISDPSTSDFTDGLFSNYNLAPSWEEAFLTAASPEQPEMNTSEPALMSTPDPMMMEDENIFDSVWDFNVEVNNASPAPSEANVIAENNIEFETFSFPTQESEELDDCWGWPSFHAPASMVEGIRFDETEDDKTSSASDKAAEIDSIYNMDIVQFALGDSGLDDSFLTGNALGTNIVKVEDGAHAQEHIVFAPEATTSSFIHPNNNFITTDQTTISLILPAIKQEPMLTNTPEPVLKRKVGRPERKTPIQITEVPKNGSLTTDQLRSYKYRRSREQNNEASRRCRKKRKEKQNKKEQECEELAEKNRELTEQLLAKETDVEAWKVRCRAVGYSC